MQIELMKQQLNQQAISFNLFFSCGLNAFAILSFSHSLPFAQSFIGSFIIQTWLANSFPAIINSFWLEILSLIQQIGFKFEANFS